MAPEGEEPGPPSPMALPRGSPSSLGLNPAALEAGVRRLRAQVDAGRLPGFLSCVIKDGQLAHYAAHGLADICSGLPVGDETLFRLYSQTKPITVVGALQLLEQGRLSLDDPVAQHIPCFADVLVGEKGRTPVRQVLVRDLFAHTSGVGFGPGFGYAPENDYEQAYVALNRRVDQGQVRSLEEWCGEIAKLPLRFQPGKDWGYGYSSDILGRIVEVVSGQPLDRYLQAHVLEPLGMHDTFFAVPAEKRPRLAALYKREPWDGVGSHVKYVTADPGGSGLTADAAKQVLDRDSEGVPTAAPSASVFLEGRASEVLQGGGCVCSVAGGLVSTVRDYARFGLMLLNEGALGGKRLLKPETVRLLARDWLNDFTTEKRRKPLWVWGTPGIGFSPLGQIGVEHPEAKSRRAAGSQLHTVHWGGAGGSGYMLNFKRHLLVLTYTGCVFDTATQKTMWRAASGALRRGRAKPAAAAAPPRDARSSQTTPAAKKRRRGEDIPSPKSTRKVSSALRRRPSAHSARKE